jgi:response regulator RpfG family c-di-GMP phosphodiesterase
MTTPKTNRKLLIVDDDPIARRAIARSLEDADYEILQAEGPSEALKVMNEHDIKIVISDQHMRGATGTGFLSVVEAKFPNTVRLLLTSDTSTDVFVAAVNDGHARRVLYKPWVDEQLRGAVRQYFGLPRRRPGAPPVFEVKPQSARTLDRIAALLGADRVS